MTNRLMRTFAATAVAFGLIASIAAASPASSAPAAVSGESGIVAVKIPASQRGAYPLYGLKAADIIYVEAVERGFTRHIAIYGTDRVPAKVGPVRSLRETDFHLLDAFGKVRVYASGHTESRAIMDNFLATTKHVLRTSDEGAQEFVKNKYCVEPFCQFLKGTSVPGRKTGLSATNTSILKKAGLVRGAVPASVIKSGKSIRSLTINYKKTPYSEVIPRTITWSASKKLWIYEASGRSSTIDVVGQKTVSGQSSSATAIIQFSSAKNAGNAFVCRSFPNGGPDSVPYTNSVGKGSGLLLRDGKMYKLTWSRATASAPTRFKFSNGYSIKIAGQPWVYLVPSNLAKTTVKYVTGKTSLIAPAATSPKWSFSTSVLKERKACSAKVKISVTKSKSKNTTIIKVASNFDSLNYVNLKSAKITIKVTGKGYLKKTTSSKTGEIVIYGDPAKVVSVTFDGQVVKLQRYAASKWGK